MCYTTSATSTSPENNQDAVSLLDLAGRAQ
jgi:hypothetical protein